MKPLTPSPEQQEILDLGLTTIRIRAGAGTGKTTTIAMVIANLVENHEIEPEQVLGITFTNKAAAELADNVREVLGQTVDAGRQVEVHTYHGFAAQVVAEFGVLAGVDNRSKIITPTFARQLMTETFHHRSYEHLDITHPRSLDRIRRLGDRLGDHLRSPSALVSAQSDPDDVVWQTRLEMAETLSQYQSDKRRLRVVDYADLVTLSTTVVIRHSELADTIRDRYRVVVLDEYQDTNPAQRTLLTSLFGSSFPVIAVGDEDQTIYEWRGASAENFELFADHFQTPDGDRPHERGLRLNRRSAQPILSIANEVRARANPVSDQLTSIDQKTLAEIHTHWAFDALAEAEWIARTFEGLHNDGVKWADMAVLFRKNKDFALVVNALTRRDIPVEVANIGGLFSVPEVADIRAWLTVLEHPENSAALTQILFGSRYRLGMADLAPLSRWIGKSNSDDDAEEADPVTLIEAVEAAHTVDGLRPPAVSALRRFQTVYRELLSESQGLSLVETCRLILDQTRAWQDIDALPSNPRLTARLNIYRLLDLAEDWSPLKGRPSVGAFLDYLEVMEDEPADELDSARLSGEDAVTLITIHRAKGLEWENVAIPAVVKGNFPTKVQQHPDPMRFAEHLPVDLRIDANLHDLPGDRKERDDYLGKKHHDQEWRVAYVAITRAKNRLFMSGAHWYGLPEPLKTPKEPSDLFALVEAHPTSVDDGHTEIGPRPSILQPSDEAITPDPIFEGGWDGGLRDAIESLANIESIADQHDVREEYTQMVADINQRLFNLAEPASVEDGFELRTVSVTGLVTMAQCSKRFYWTDVDPLPRKPSLAATRGTQIHRRIELHQRGQIPFEELTQDLYDQSSDEGDGGSIGGYDAYIESRFADNTADLIEAPFSLELDNGYRVRGRIDAIYCEGPNWEVVDFKSGKQQEDPSRVVQLQAYAVAVSDADLGRQKPDRIDVTFAYLGGGLDEVTYHADQTWVTQARRVLNDLTDAIAKEQFGESPGWWCRNCDFLRFCEPGQIEVSG